MKALIITFGSTGDIYPMLGLSKALLAAGHEVCFATASLFGPEIESEGVPFVAVPPEWNFDQFKAVTRELCSTNNRLKQFGYIYDTFGPFIAETQGFIAEQLKDYDVLVATYLFPFFKTLADAQSKPFVTVAFSNNTMPRWDCPPEDVPSLHFLPAFISRPWNMAWWHVVDSILNWRIRRALKPFLEDTSKATIGSFVFGPAEHVIVASSQTLMKKAEPANERFHITGYLRYQNEKDPNAQQTLDAFCAGHAVPIITFGSMAASDSQQKFERFLREWPDKKKLIVQSGWADLKVPQNKKDSILLVGKMSHDQLFQYASVVVHHGGAGTTASVLHAGKPHVIIPHLGDQYFWADEIVKLGLGLEVTYRRWPKRLQNAIEQIETNATFSQQADSLGKAINQEDGLGNAVSLLERITE